MPSKSIHVFAKCKIVLFYGWIMCVCVCVCIYLTFSLSIYSSMDTSCFHIVLLWTVLQWSWRCIHFFEFVFSFSLGKYHWPQMWGFISVLSILFHWSICLFTTCTIQFWLQYLCNIYFENRKCNTASYVLLLKIAYLWSFIVSYIF